jgi:hypothetical protein
MEQQQVYVDPHAGKLVQYTDEVGKVHNALVTICHGGDLGVNAINLVYVSDDATQRDPYGRQIARASSVSAQGPHTAHGRFYVVPE